MTTLQATPSTGLLERITAFGERRHEALAGNIANIQTPGYRMRDLPVEEFQKALQEAVTRMRSTAPPAEADLARPEARRPPLFPDRLFQASRSAPKNLTFHDANNRSVEHQMSELIKNTMMQSFAMELLRFQFNSLQSVISEQP